MVINHELIFGDNLLSGLSGGSLHCEEFLNGPFVGARNKSEVGEVALLLLGFLGEDVALESVFSLNLS